MEKLRLINNHPVHIFEKNGTPSPTAFIPFCSFGGKMETVGAKSPNFDVPVCNSFKTQIRNDQLCYQIDLEDYRNSTNIEKQLKEGLVLILDYNEERQMIRNKLKEKNEKGLFLSSDDKNSVQVYLDTISKYIKKTLFTFNLENQY